MRIDFFKKIVFWHNIEMIPLRNQDHKFYQIFLVYSTILLLFVGNFWLIVLEEFGIVYSGFELLAERAFSIMGLFLFSITSSYIYLALRSVKSGEEKEILATV